MMSHDRNARHKSPDPFSVVPTPPSPFQRSRAPDPELHERTVPVLLLDLDVERDRPPFEAARERLVQTAVVRWEAAECLVENFVFFASEN
jgi:hypothetical protein